MRKKKSCKRPLGWLLFCFLPRLLTYLQSTHTHTQTRTLSSSCSSIFLLRHPFSRFWALLSAIGPVSSIYPSHLRCRQRARASCNFFLASHAIDAILQGCLVNTMQLTLTHLHAARVWLNPGHHLLKYLHVSKWCDTNKWVQKQNLSISWKCVFDISAKPDKIKSQ